MDADRTESRKRGRDDSPRPEEGADRKRARTSPPRRSPRRSRSRSRSPRQRSRSRSPKPRGRSPRKERSPRRRSPSSSSSSSSSRGRDKRRKAEKEKAKEDERKNLEKVVASVGGRSGGVYIPPHKMRLLEKQVKDKSSEQYQRLTWDALKKSLNGLINKISQPNIVNVIPEVFNENLIRGRGLLCRSLMKSQQASPSFTNVYAALMAVVNTKLPMIGELLLKRLINQWKLSYMRNQKGQLIATTTFIAHLVNQFVCDVMIPLQILALLLDKPTDDSVEVAVNFVKECGQRLSELSPKPFNGIFTVFRSILHEGKIDKRVQYMIEDLFLIRKNQFKDHLALMPALDLVEEGDQITHMELSLDEDYTPEDLDEAANLYHFDASYEDNEKKYDTIRKEILGDDSSDSAGDGSSSESDGEEKGEGGAPSALGQGQGGVVIEDQTDLDVVHFKRTVYLTIMSALDFEECAHKLLKNGIKEGLEVEVLKMIVECCAQEKTYRRFYGLLAQRFAMLKPLFRELLAHTCFPEQYEACHLYETTKLRNVATFFAHLLHTDALPWTILQYLHLNEEETNSSKRIFIKIVFKEMAEFLGLKKLNDRLNDPDMQQYFQFLLPRDSPKNTRFAINFFTSIGLGGLTYLFFWVALRDHLKNAKAAPVANKEESSSSSSDSSDSSDSDSSSGSSDSSSSSSSSDDKQHKKRR